MNVTITLAGIPIGLKLTYPDYLPFYEPYLTTEKPVARAGMTADEINAALGRYANDTAPEYVEHVELCPRLSNVLLEHDRAFFHAAAFVWREKAWLFTAPPGIGKTTQYLLWKRLYGDEVCILNGDKPILECSENGITVHPSPWNGKENMGGRTSAPLGGIIILEQAEENSIQRQGKEAIIPLFKQFLFLPNCDAVKAVFEIEDKMLRSAPVFKLRNCGDDASVRLCRDTLEEVLA